MAIIGMDIHRSFVQAAFLQDGQINPLDRGAVAGGLDNDLVLDRQRLRELDETIVNELDPLLSLSCAPSSSASSWRIREWFARSPTRA